MKSNSKEEKRGLKKLDTIRTKLFFTLCITITIIISFLIIVNSIVLESYYMYSKQAELMSAYRVINAYYNGTSTSKNIEVELEKLALSNNFDILIKTENSIYASSRDFVSSLTDEFDGTKADDNLLLSTENVKIKKTFDQKTELSFILLSANLDNGYQLYIRVATISIQESVDIANKFLMLIGCVTMAISGLIASMVARKFTSPIEELNDITEKISELDFSHKYQINDSEDEINNLGKNINTMSETLEKTINRLRSSNIELEKDIEEKSKTDEMRKQFISDVSHELKTPIALIQGYAEGLVENVTEDAESRKFYAEVILDEANKMDVLVKRLLELMKLEYGKMTFNLTKFNISELISEVIRKNTKILEEENIKIEFENNLINVIGDEFYIEQVFNNYFTNALKNVSKIEGRKEIVITTQEKEGKLRIKVFNTGENIAEENLNRIWNRFYKVDTSRNRERGGTGIGLSLVRAIMQNTNNKYGVKNKIDGVEFYFEVDLEKK